MRRNIVDLLANSPALGCQIPRARSYLLAAFVCGEHTKTDLTAMSRSVALLARPHPKCPIQVRLPRVRALPPVPEY
ncbi:MAG: hypothetical protein KatS3mg065_0890 [Chloroflexota bacterium]|nr:MAG: hypothetical protein KatS3mg065_0890 [Chloroflexota bacterium]